jgi:hypothetical protein
MSAEGAAQSDAMIDEVAWDKVPALRASRLIKKIATTPLRAWLLNVGPPGLSSNKTQSTKYTHSSN